MVNLILLPMAIIISIALFRYHWKRRHFYRLSWKMAGPFSFPIIGNSLMFLDSSQIMKKVERLGHTYGLPMRFWLGNRFVILYNRPEHLEVILNSPQTLDKGNVYEFITKVMGGEGLFTSSGPKWKQHRKLLNPTIQHFAILQSFYPIFNKNLAVLMDKLKLRVGQKAFNIYEVLEACSLDMICETTFGIEMNTQDNQNMDFLHSAHNMMHVAGILIFQPWLQVDSIFRLSKYHKLLTESTINARSFASKIIQKKAKEYQGNVNNNSGPDVKKQQNNFIDECLKLSLHEKCFDETDMINESLTMLIGGFETTATTVSYIVLMLAMYPEYQQQAFEEVRSVFPDQSSAVSAEDTGKLDFTNRFIKESMRLNPTVPFVGRTAKHDLVIGEHQIPSGTDMIVALFMMQRGTDIWGPTASTFDPDHFLPENLSTKHSYSYLPYSAGPRNCIGLKYANIVVRMFVCWLIRHYRFETPLTMDTLQYRMSVTLKLDNGHMVSVHERTDY